ncbi:hypothetical protein SEA_ABT2GRADUATEX2_42 [Streptomyces phage Abt2graduatex2]|nr:hypothetical protein SEA_ABT2GRADUATEX2_42 [Streptomyces phage Abt2graduatex2]
MARRLDTGWRDGLLAVRHAHWGHEAPAVGMKFPMIEYDRGEPLAVISYQRRGEQLPTGRDVAAAYTAFGRLHRKTGEQLPFLTVQYDVRNWSYRVFAHNEPAWHFLGRGWTKMTEQQYVNNLYRLRGRHAPDLAAYGVDFSSAEWLDDEPDPSHRLTEDWPHQLMSTRRRNFEPVGQTRMTWRNPCLDVDLAVVDRDENLALVVDYKAPGARINMTSTNMQALGGLHSSRGLRGSGFGVAAMLVSYQPTKPQWQVRVHCLNQSARLHLAYVLGGGGTTEQLAATIAGAEWTDVSEAQWRSVLDAARDL